MFNKRQKEIMQAAMDIAGKEGMKALTISNIARRISVTDGAIYRHFSSKDEIIRSILNTIFLISKMYHLQLNRQCKCLEQLQNHILLKK